MKWIKDSLGLLLIIGTAALIIGIGIWIDISIVRSDLPFWIKWILLR